jgi:hypothetical protein
VNILLALVLPGYSKIIRAKSRNGDAFDSQRSQYQFCDAKYLGLMKEEWVVWRETRLSVCEEQEALGLRDILVV